MKNITLAYILAFLKSSWFWLGIWILYYLRFTSYSGIGILETIMIFTSTFSEIPTGAIGDLLGKKLTLFLSYIFPMIANIIMGFAPNFTTLFIGVIIYTIGGSFNSGTFEALIFDTLKDGRKEHEYHKIIANTQSLSLIAFAVTSIIGGFLYTIFPGLPFVFTGIAYGVGALFCIFLEEPKTDTYQFTFKNYLKQNIQGIRELFKTVNISRITIGISIIAMIGIVTSNFFTDAQLTGYGFTSTQLGVLGSIMYLFAAGVSFISPKILKKTDRKTIIIVSSFIFSLSLFLSAWFALYLGAFVLAIRWATQTIFDNTSSEMINLNTESKYRATTLSSYQMLIKLPYVFSAYLLGILIDQISTNTFAFSLGLLVLCLLSVQIFLFSQNSRNAPHARI